MAQWIRRPGPGGPEGPEGGWTRPSGRTEPAQASRVWDHRFMVGVFLGAMPATGEEKAAVFIITVTWLAMLTRARAWWRYVPPPEGSTGRSPGWLMARRNRPCTIVLAGFLVAASWFGLLASGPNGVGWAKPVTAGLLLCTLGTFGVSIAIILYNRPRRFVPPALRNEPGLSQ